MGLDEFEEKFKDKYLINTSNIFEAINLWTKDSQKLQTKYQNTLNSSEALSSTLSGNLPDNLNKRKNVKYVDESYKYRYIQEALKNVEDLEVKQSVYYSLMNSFESKKLQYKYLKTLTASQKSRVRIICKLIWFNLFSEKG